MEAAAVFAVVLNRADTRAFWLALVVGLSVCAPLSPDSLYAWQWYLMLGAVEFSVVLFAAAMNTKASAGVMLIHFVLMLIHATQYMIAPYEGEPSIYPVIIPALESLSILYICFTSTHFLRGYHGNVGG